MDRNSASGGYRLGEREPVLLNGVDPSLPRTRFDYSPDSIDRLLPAASLALDKVRAEQEELIRHGDNVHSYLILDEMMLLGTIEMLSEDTLALAEAAEFSGGIE